MVLTTSRLTCPSVLMSVDTAYSDQQIVFPIFITLGKVYSSGLFLFSLIHACYAVFQPCDLCSTDSQFICLLIYQVFMLSALFWHTLPMIIIFYQSSLTIDSLNRSRALSLGLWIAFSGSSFVAGFFSAKYLGSLVGLHWKSFVNIERVWLASTRERHSIHMELCRLHARCGFIRPHEPVLH